MAYWANALPLTKVAGYSSPHPNQAGLKPTSFNTSDIARSRSLFVQSALVSNSETPAESISTT